MTLRITLLLALLFWFNSSQAQDDCDDLAIPQFCFGDWQVNVGDNVCFDFTVKDYFEVESFNFALSFDPTVLQYEKFTDLNVLGQPILINDSSQAVDVGLVYLVYTPFAILETLSDNTVIGQFCFDIIGDPGDNTKILIVAANNTNIDVQFGDGCNITFESLCVGLVENACDDLFIHSGVCPGMNSDGSINFSFCGGTPSYDWTLTGPSLSQSGTSALNVLEDIGNLASGVYMLTVQDAVGTMATETITVENTPPLTINLIERVDPPCHGFTGTLEVEATGGDTNSQVLGYKYTWSNGQFTPRIVQLPNQAIYTVTVEDSNGCSETASFEFDTPEIIFEIIEIIPDACNESIGSIEYRISGGVPFSPNNDYLLRITDPTPQNPIMTQGGIIVNLAAGLYNIRVTDNAILTNGSGCSINIPFEIPEVQGTLSVTSSQSNASCFGTCDGSFTLDVNETGIFSLSSANNEDTGLAVDASQINFIDNEGFLQLTDLCAGLYSLSLQDTSDCSFDTTFIITEPLPLGFDTNVTNAQSCIFPDGQIIALGTGGVGSYQFTWDPNLGNSNTITQLPPGSYSVTVVDGNQCRDSITLVVEQDNLAEISIEVLSPIGCNGSTMGQLVALPSDNMDYSYEWFETTTSLLLGSDSILSNVNVGTFHVNSVNVSSGCVDSDTITMTSVNDLDFDMTFTDPTCFDSGDGTVELFNITGGAVPYQTFWPDFPSETDTIITVLTAGTFNVTLTDFFGCVKDTFVTLVAPPSIIPDVDIDQIQFASCFDSNDGEYTVSASSGVTTTGYTFDWPDPIQDEFNVDQSTASNLAAGDYNLTISDEIGCSIEVPFTINGPDPIILDDSATLEIEPDCPLICDGILSLAFLGGTPASIGPAYSVLWNDSSTDLERMNLCPEVYTVIVTDDADCTAEFSFDLTVQGDPLEVKVDSLLSRSLSCMSDDDGQIGVVVSGGIGDPANFEYEWTDDVAFDSFASNLQTGNYSVIVTDMNGCTATTSYDIEASNPIVANIPEPALANCAGGQSCFAITSVIGGSGSPYFFQINNQAPPFPLDTCVDLFAGTYNITIIDSLACTFDTLIEIFEPMITSVELGGDLEFELGESEAEIEIDYTGDFAITDVSWAMSDSFDCQTPLCEAITLEVTQDQLVSVVVTDENGCTAIDDLQIIVNNQRRAFIPNMILPGDLDNGLVMVYPGQGSTLVKSFGIYDRWGNQVYGISDIPVSDVEMYGWDGMIQSRKAEIGVYISVAEILFIDGETRVFTSDLTVIR